MNFLIDPNDVIDYNRSHADLELMWAFTLVVAGKTATTQARLLNNFLNSLPAADLPENDSPFERIHKARDRGILLDKLIESRLGQYNRLHRAFQESLTLDLSRCSVADLEAIHGVGPKSARMFLMFTRPNQRFAALDTHVLKYLASQGHTVPKSTPPAGEKYRKLENLFLELADSSGMTVAEFDLSVWRQYSNGRKATV